MSTTSLEGKKQDNQTFQPLTCIPHGYAGERREARGPRRGQGANRQPFSLHGKVIFLRASVYPAVETQV